MWRNFLSIFLTSLINTLSWKHLLLDDSLFGNCLRASGWKMIILLGHGILSNVHLGQIKQILFIQIGASKVQFDRGSLFITRIKLEPSQLFPELPGRRWAGRRDEVRPRRGQARPREAPASAVVELWPHHAAVGHAEAPAGRHNGRRFDSMLRFEITNR